MAAISTVPLYTAQNPGWNYEALPYSIDDLPAPLPPRSEKLPWERKEALEKERQEHNVAETQKAYDEAARQKGTHASSLLLLTLGVLQLAEASSTTWPQL